jgi:hypothetical protein
VLLLIAAYLALTIYLLTHFTLHYPHQTAPVSWGTALRRSGRTGQDQRNGIRRSSASPA